MKAMIFAAGLGTRLRPITNEMPKALVPVGGMPLLEIAIRRLKAAGITEFVVNVHHFADMIEAFLADHHHFGCTIHLSDERDLLLDTGGGLRKARAHFADGPFLAYNVDVLSDLRLPDMLEAHQRNRGLATLAVRRRASSRHLLFDTEMRLVGWRHNRRGEEKRCRPGAPVLPLAFSGIQIIEPDLFRFMPREEEGVFSIIDTYLEAGKNQTLYGYRHDESLWLDVGKREALKKAEKVLVGLQLA